jgi:caspase domain-containing protein
MKDEKRIKEILLYYSFRLHPSSFILSKIRKAKAMNRVSSLTLRLSLLTAAWLIAFHILHAVASAQTEGRGLQVQVGAWPGAAKRFALIVGVDEYEDTQIGRLDGAGNDARSLADALIRYAGFPKDQVVLLAPDQPRERRPTRGNILRRLSNLRSAVPKDGLLLVAFAGHGVEREGRAYLLPSDAQVSGDVSLLEDTAINVEVVRDRIRQTGVEQVVIVLDACRNDPAGRGEGDNRLSEVYTRSFSFAARNSEVIAFATLYATAVGDRAYEYKEKKQGYFTWALVEGLKGAAANDKGEVTLGGLVKYLEETVPRRIVLDLGKDKKQRPFAVIEGYKADELVIAVAPRAVASSIPGKKESITPADPAELIRSARTVYVESKSKWFKANSVENELRKHPDFDALGLKLVKDKKRADLLIELDRPLWSFTFNYTVIHPETSVIVASGQVGKSPAGKSVSPTVADEIIKQLKAVRGAIKPNQ